MFGNDILRNFPPTPPPPPTSHLGQGRGAIFQNLKMMCSCLKLKSLIKLIRRMASRLSQLAHFVKGGRAECLKKGTPVQKDKERFLVAVSRPL